MSKLRKILFAVAAFGGAATAVGAGTFATFTASTSNTGVFATGTIELSNTSPTQTSCMSSGSVGGADVNGNACTALTAISVKKPGDAATPVPITLENTGSIAASALKVYTTTPCAGTGVGGNATAEDIHGTGDVCTMIGVTVQSYVDAARLTPNGCVYGADINADSICDPVLDYTKDLTAFSSYTSGAPLSISAGGAGLGVDAKKYLTLGFKMDSTADNTFQGRQAAFNFVWSIEQ